MPYISGNQIIRSLKMNGQIIISYFLRIAALKTRSGAPPGKIIAETNIFVSRTVFNISRPDLIYHAFDISIVNNTQYLGSC